MGQGWGQHWYYGVGVSGPTTKERGNHLLQAHPWEVEELIQACGPRGWLPWLGWSPSSKKDSGNSPASGSQGQPEAAAQVAQEDKRQARRWGWRVNLSVSDLGMLAPSVLLSLPPSIPHPAPPAVVRAPRLQLGSENASSSGHSSSSPWKHHGGNRRAGVC